MTSRADTQTRFALHGCILLLIGAYCNAMGPWITALFIGHRVIEPHTALEALVVYDFYIPGTLPLISFIIFVMSFWRVCRAS